MIIELISSGGLGDAILTTPIFSALKKSTAGILINVYCFNKQHIEVYKNNPHIDILKSTSFYDLPIHNIRQFFNPNYFRRLKNNFYSIYHPSKVYKHHASQIIADLINVKLESTISELYLTKDEEQFGFKFNSQYKLPVVINITSISSSNQHWPVKNWEHLIAMMPHVTFIQLGNANEHYVKGAVNFLGKTTIRQTFAILKYAKSFIGVVSALAHASNALNIRGIVLFGPSSPNIWGHDNNHNVYKHFNCSPCIDVLGSSPCPYNSECMAEINPAEISKLLNSILFPS